MLVPICIVGLIAAATGSSAQQPTGTVSTPPAQGQKIEERVEIVAVTPIHGLGLSKLKVPSNVQVITAKQVQASTLDVPHLLGGRAASVQTVETHGGTFQSDVLFRGSSGSPLLGASEGLAVYQDGVRINEAFGDTVNWDALPTAAIASINLSPGSNPLFGLNALGGAVSIQTKNGFAFPGTRARVTTGSFGRHQLHAESGGHHASIGYFVAVSVTDEAGWRDFSPSTLRRMFGDFAWRGTESTFNVTVTGASNDLTGNGAAPIDLLERDRAAVFTHPDSTENDLGLLTLRAQRPLPSAVLSAVAYYRHSRIGTFNGDAAENAEESGDGLTADSYDGVNHISHTRADARGVSGQITRTEQLWGRDNHFIVGASVDTSLTKFDSASELARLTDARGTVGTGLFDVDAFIDLHTRTTTHSVFVTNTWSPMKRLHLTGSARVNWTSVSLRDQIGTDLNGDHQFRRLNPSTGLTYQMIPAVNLFAGYAQASRVPTPVELTCADPEDPCRLPNAFVSDPPLKQIVADTWEAGARGSGGGVTWSVSAFRTESKDDIIFVSSGTRRGEGHFENVDATRRAGLEATAEYAVTDRLTAFATYSLQRATFGTDLRITSQFHPLANDTEIVVRLGDQLPGIPTHAAKAGFEIGMKAGLRLGVSMSAQSSRYLRGDEANLLDPVPGFAVVHAQAQQRITNRVTLVGHVQNVFDSDYATFGILGDAELLGDEFVHQPRFHSPGAPRGAWISLGVRF